MKTTTYNQCTGLLSQTELVSTLIPKPQYRLRTGDTIRLDEGICRVIRVSESAAVIAIPQPPRDFETVFGKRVHIQPKPRLVRISSNSEVPILKREGDVL